MTYAMDTVTPTTTGAGVTAEVRLNADSPIQVPDGINNIVSAIPYYCPAGAFSPDESYVTRIRLQSNDISIEPARFMMSAVNSGDAAFASIGAPILQEFNLNIPNANGSNINIYATPMKSNAVATDVGCELVYSTSSTGSQQYWNTPDSLSVGGTAIDTRTSLNSITITDGREVTSLNMLVAPTTAAASTHDCGEAIFQSSDFQVPFPYSFPIQPSFSGLGAAAAQLTNPIGLSRQRFPAGHGIPLAPRALLNSFYVNRDAKGVGSTIMPFVSFTR